MQSVSGILGILHNLMKKHKIINISGESGTGKTTFGLQLVGNFLTSNYPFKESCIWVQANESFPIKRLLRMFKNSPEKVSYLQKNIFITPRDKCLNTYSNQSQLVRNIIDGHTTLPPNLRFIVIDNISHHFRYEISKYKNINLIISLIDDFYDSQLLPLIMFCQRKGIYLVLIHEISYDPNAEKNRSFLFKLYDRLDTLKIELEYMYNRCDRKARILTQDYYQEFLYTLHDMGLEIK
ncbi:MAG: AAA family ATPase [Candidatus Hodarchaeota archaeon]